MSKAEGALESLRTLVRLAQASNDLPTIKRLLDDMDALLSQALTIDTHGSAGSERQ
jgi:hypothetical protein